MFRLICLILGYFIGCFQTAFIVGKAFGKIDIREHGSGNAGMTNITRVMGAKAGLAVFISDILKAVVGYYICTLIFNGLGTFFIAGNGENLWLPGLYGAIGVILGHNFPFYMKFKGGKGIAATIGLILSLDIRVALVVYFFGIIGVASTRYISVASLAMALVLPISMLFFGFLPEAVVLGVIVGALAYYQHRSNIVRLANGTENKFTIKRK